MTRKLETKLWNGVTILPDGTFRAICTVCYGAGCETCKGIEEGYEVSKIPTSFPTDLLWEDEQKDDEDDGTVDYEELYGVEQ